MTRPLPTLREFRKAYKETGLRMAQRNWGVPWTCCACPLGAVAASCAPRSTERMSWCDRRFGKVAVGGFTHGFDGGRDLSAEHPPQHRARYLAAFKHGRRVRRALIGGDK